MSHIVIIMSATIDPRIYLYRGVVIRGAAIGSLVLVLVGFIVHCVGV